MNVLVVNCGSSSLKFQLIDADTEKVLASGICDRIGIDGSVLNYKNAAGKKYEQKEPIPNHTKAIEMVLESLINKEYGTISSLEDIHAIGHRVVHGGEFFKESVLINDYVIDRIKECSDLAPLHNPAHLMGIEACKAKMPNTPMVVVFDTAFHQTMPPKAYIYGVPYEWYEKHKVRRYGFHGTSHKYVSQKTAEFLGLDYYNSKIIVCHLGNGSSITAVKNGRRIADETAQSLVNVVEGAKDVAVFVERISTASKNQKDTLERLTKGVNQISGIIQENSAMAEESAAASVKLFQQAHTLRQLVDVFELKKV